MKDITESQKQAISNFITYGTLGTQNLNRSARYRMVLAYRVEYKKFPTSEANWLALLNQPPGMNVLICGIRVGDKHEENVKKSFILGFNSYKKDLTPDLITISTSTMPSNCFREAEENNYPMAIMSLKEASYSNGYVAGQIAYIAKKLGISVSQARTIARETASFTKSFTAEDGFGQIQIEQALARGKK